MTNFFDMIGQIFNFIGDMLMMFVQFFVSIGRALLYVNTVMTFIPGYIKLFMTLFISISIVLLILNRG